MKALPLVTVAIPNYNYSQYICEALESVALQNYSPIEVLVFDDQSTDDSISVISNWINNYKGSMQVKLLCTEKNGGLTKACNKLLNNATGAYIQFLDADDMILSGKIERQVEMLEANTDAALIYSDTALIDEHGGLFGKGYLQRIGYEASRMPTGNVHTELFKFNFVPLPSVLIRTELLRNEGGFDETVGVQDYYMWLRLSANYKFLFDDVVSAKYRVHNSSMSNSNLTNPNSIWSVLEIKYRYYKQADKDVRRYIRQCILASAPYLYRYNHPYAKKWVRRNLFYNPSLKNLLQHVCIVLNIPYFSIGGRVKMK